MLLKSENCSVKKFKKSKSTVFVEKFNFLSGVFFTETVSKKFAFSYSGYKRMFFRPEN